jgi:hypothetical protein
MQGLVYGDGGSSGVSFFIGAGGIATFSVSAPASPASAAGKSGKVTFVTRASSGFSVARSFTPSGPSLNSALPWVRPAAPVSRAYGTHSVHVIMRFLFASGFTTAAGVAISKFM